MNRTHLSLLFFLLFLFINIIFNYKIIKEDIVFPEGNAVSIDDGVVTEFLTDLEYQRLRSFKNPFTPTNALFYPFTTPIALNDTSAVNFLFFPLLRPFFDIHQSTLVIVLFNIFLSNLLMYFLLRRLRVHQYGAFLGSLIFGFMPSIVSKITGHYTYTALYFFPLLFLVGHEFIQSSTYTKKLLYSSLFGIFLGASLYANPYYFVILLLGSAVYFIIFFFLKRKEFFDFFFKNIPYFFVSFILFFLILFPLLSEIKKTVELQGPSEKVHIGSSIILSSDLFNLIIPSEYNPIYNFLFKRLAQAPFPLSKFSHFFFYSWNSFSYPGIIILLSIIFLVIYWKRIDVVMKDRIRPHMFAGMFFFILMLGPFLKLFNRWMIVLDENIPVYIPLPFLLIRLIPGLETLRAPVRFTTVFIFFGAIVFAMLFDWALKKTKTKKQIFLFLLFFAVFFLDQMYVVHNRISNTIPLKIYEYIKQDKNQSTVLEIPFTVRDGLQYAGFVHATSIMKGPLLHNKPIIGGYLSRVHPSVFQYYQNLPFIGHVAKIIDKGNYHLYKEQPKEPNVSAFIADIQTITDELDFLNMRYVILKQNEAYSSVIQDVLKKTAFNPVMQDGEYQLFQRELKQKEFTTVSFGSNADYLHIAQGFSLKESGFRWAEGKRAKVFVRTDEPKKNILTFKAASFHASQDVLVYVNEIYAGQKLIDVEENSYSLDISDMLQPGINTIFFKFSQTYKPSVMLLNNNDMRDLAVKFYSLKIE